MSREVNGCWRVMPWCVIAHLLLIVCAKAGERIELRSRHLALEFRPETATACAWENLLTSARLEFTGGCELQLEVGEKPELARTVEFVLAGPVEFAPQADRATMRLRSADGAITAVLSYWTDEMARIVHKSAEIVNAGAAPLRVLSVVLGRYRVKARTEGGERGFPLYLDGQFFVSLAHPAGFAHIENGQVVLRQYPGVKLAPGQRFHSMEAVYGVSPENGAREAFVEHIRSRMRRIVRGHRGPYAVLEAFGGQPDGDFYCKESYLLEHLAKVEKSLNAGGPRFDFYCTEFWHDSAGDLTTFHPKNFPHGYARVRDEILRLGMKPALWIDSGGLPDWTIGRNPAVRGCFTEGDGRGQLCRASEPINSMYKQAFIHQVRANKVGLLKFDNLGPDCQPPGCNNPAHGHLPGPLYSVEAIHSAVIDFLQALDKACPEVFIILYWGYRSPWWLLYGDMYFESGLHIEGASAADCPAPFARDSVTLRLDQAQSLIRDTPWLGKDSLGIWLSEWPWNSCVGKGRWQEGLVMDMFRGNLLAQIWTDTNFLTPAERTQLADFLALLRANPACFDQCRFITGDPSKPGLYGYAACDGRRNLLAMHNAQLTDTVANLDLSGGGRLFGHGPWDVYRWYPQPARLVGNSENLPDDLRPVRGSGVSPLEECGGTPDLRSSRMTSKSWGNEAKMAMRPYEVVLLEVVPRGQAPSLLRAMRAAPMPTSFREPTRRLELLKQASPISPAKETVWHVVRPASVRAGKATLALLDDSSVLASGDNVSGDVYTIKAPTDLRTVGAVLLETLSDNSLPEGGPGRAVNGNYALTKFRMLIAAREGAGEVAEVRLRRARADFSQTTFGGWPVEAALGGSATRGWSIHPQTGRPHAAIFELERPIKTKSGQRLTFQLTQGERGHSLGRLRLSVTEQQTPQLPASYRQRIQVLSTHIPSSHSAGLLLLTANKDASLARVTLGGKELSLNPVWSEHASWQASWKAWRAELPPCGDIRQLSVFCPESPPGAIPMDAYWIPRDRQ
jgi:hypothetical protein